MALIDPLLTSSAADTSLGWVIMTQLSAHPGIITITSTDRIIKWLKRAAMKVASRWFRQTLADLGWSLIITAIVSFLRKNT